MRRGGCLFLLPVVPVHLKNLEDMTNDKAPAWPVKGPGGGLLFCACCGVVFYSRVLSTDGKRCVPRGRGALLCLPIETKGGRGVWLHIPI